MPIIATPVTPSPATPPLSWTKRQFVEAAFNELALAGYSFELEPEQLDYGLSLLDSMMSEWYEAPYSLDIGYPLPVDSTTSLNDVTTISFADNRAVFTNLALSLAASHGKNLAPSTLNQASKSLEQLLFRYMTMPSRVLDATAVPAGAGYKDPLDPFLVQL